MRYSGWRILKEALTGHKGWTAAWRDRPTWDPTVTPNIRGRTGSRSGRRRR